MAGVVRAWLVAGSTGWLDLLDRATRSAGWLVRRSRRGGYVGDGFGWCMGGDRGV